jgi:hypothetical protein
MGCVVLPIEKIAILLSLGKEFSFVFLIFPDDLFGYLFLLLRGALYGIT